jgi:transposase
VPRVDDRRVLIGIFWVLRSGAPKSNRRWKPCFSKRLYRERNLIERQDGEHLEARQVELPKESSMTESTAAGGLDL